MPSNEARAEDRAVTPLRALIFVIFALGVAAGWVSHGLVRWFVICFYVPGGWTYVRPRWPQITIWIMWAVTWAMLVGMLALGSSPQVRASRSLWLMAAAAVLLCVGVPLVRRLHAAPPAPAGRRSRIPEARVHVRD